jgi:hypothetical protein
MAKRKRPPDIGRHREAFFRSASYLKMTIRAGRQLREGYDSLAAVAHESDARQFALIDFMTDLHVGGYSFVMALHQACLWLKVLATYEPSIKNNVRGFTAALLEVENLRHMYEHETEYANGGGKLRHLWSRRDPKLGGLSQPATGVSMLTDADGVWHGRIGGRLDVRMATESAERMFVALRIAAKRLPPLGPPSTN